MIRRKYAMALKRTLALLSVSTILLSMCACGKNDVPSPGNTSTSDESAYGSTSSEPAPAPDTSEIPNPEPPAPVPEVEEPEAPLGVTIEIIGTTLYVRGRGPMDDYPGTQSPFWQEGITEVVIEEGVTYIGKYSFAGINGLTKVTLPETLEKIGGYAFARTPITEIDLPSNLVDIDTAAFDFCESLTTITGGENLMHIGGGAFNNVPYVENYPEDTLIMGHCFVKYNGSDSEVVVPEGVTAIAMGAFQSCRTINSVVLPESLLEIGNRAFYDCRGLTSIHIPDSVHTLNGGAFADCYELRSVTGGNGLLYVGNDIFRSTYWRSQNWDDFVILGSALLEYQGSLSEIVVPEGIKAVAATAFQMMKGSKSIYLPDGLVAIEIQAFHQANATTVSMPATVEYIGKHVFLGSRVETIVFRGTEDQWKILDQNGKPYVLDPAITVEYAG